MAKTVGRNTNRNDTATITAGIVMNNSTSVTIQSATSDRMGLTIFNEGAGSVWIKFQAATVDNDKKGILIRRNSIYEMPTDNMYTGEVSGIADAANGTVFPTEI